MKTAIIVVALACGLMCGCGKKESAQGKTTNAPAVGQNPIMAPVDYLGAVNQAQKYAVKQIDIAQIKQSVNSFQAAEERYPKSLEEMVQKGYLGKIPDAPRGMKLDYDPKTGEIKVVKVSPTEPPPAPK